MAPKKPLKIDLTAGVDTGKLRPAERRREATRNRIAREAGLIFERHGGEKRGGHEKTTAEEIADQSDISVRTFFRYYQSKTDAIYVDVPSAVSAHLALTSNLLEVMRPADASLAASVVLLTNALGHRSASDRLLQAMSSKIFVARRSMLRQEWRQELAELIASQFGEKTDRELKSLTIATSTLNIREIAMEYWYWNVGKISVVDCFNKALATNYQANQSGIPRSLVV